jgi:hypothetical protein
MLILKILKKDFLRQKSTTLVVFALIMISAMLFAGGSGLIVQLTGALDSLFESSKAPHFVQMHAGEINDSEIKKWAAAGMAVSVLITALFLKLLISGDLRQIAIMKSLGFALHDIRRQYLTKTLLTLAAGILLGTLFANTMGESIVSFLWSFMGASQIRFVIDPLMAYFIFPLILLALVSITTLAGIRGIKETKITDIITE